MSNNGHAPKKRVWAFNEKAKGAYVGLPLSDKEFMEQLEKDFPKETRLGKDIRAMNHPVRAGTEHRSFTVGSRPVFDADGMFTATVEVGSGFVFCQDRGIAHALGIPVRRTRCELCLTSTPCASHPPEKRFLGWYGLREVFVDVTRQGLEQEEIDNLRASEAQKILKQKEEELGRAGAETRKALELAAQKDKELAELKKALAEKDAELFRAKAAKK